MVEKREVGVRMGVPLPLSTPKIGGAHGVGFPVLP